jgi:hypothetical protein
VQRASHERVRVGVLAAAREPRQGGAKREGIVVGPILVALVLGDLGDERRLLEVAPEGLVGPRRTDEAAADRLDAPFPLRARHLVAPQSAGVEGFGHLLAVLAQEPAQEILGRLRLAGKAVAVLRGVGPTVCSHRTFSMIHTASTTRITITMTRSMVRPFTHTSN